MSADVSCTHYAQLADDWGYAGSNELEITLYGYYDDYGDYCGYMFAQGAIWVGAHNGGGWICTSLYDFLGNPENTECGSFGGGGLNGWTYYVGTNLVQTDVGASAEVNESFTNYVADTPYFWS